MLSDLFLNNFLNDFSRCYLTSFLAKQYHSPYIFLIIGDFTNNLFDPSLLNHILTSTGGMVFRADSRTHMIVNYQFQKR